MKLKPGDLFIHKINDNYSYQGVVDKVVDNILWYEQILEKSGNEVFITNWLTSKYSYISNYEKQEQIIKIEI